VPLSALVSLWQEGFFRERWILVVESRLCNAGIAEARRMLVKNESAAHERGDGFDVISLRKQINRRDSRELIARIH
jgi:hypothetical protein